jgi:hypothetical protein
MRTVELILKVRQEFTPPVYAVVYDYFKKHEVKISQVLPFIKAVIETDQPVDEIYTELINGLTDGDQLLVYNDEAFVGSVELRSSLPFQHS